MLNKLIYFNRRIKEAPLRITLRKIGRIFMIRLYHVFYWAKKKDLIKTRHNFSGSSEAIRSIGVQISKILIQNGLQDLPYRRAALERGRTVLANDFKCLGYGIGQIPAGTEWYSDQFHNHSWSYQYFNKINFVATGSRCDVKVPWELSRMQYLPWLAEAILFDPDNKDAYLDAFGRITKDWVAYNRPGYGVNWTCPMEVAFRACNLLLAAAICWPFLSESLQRSIIISAEDHANFINHFPEFSDVPGNHYLSNLMGVAVIYEILSGSKAKRTVEARAIFHAEANSQFEQGGCHLERAPVYHRLCLDMIALVCAFEAKNSIDTTNDLWKPLKEGIEFCHDMSSSSGKLPVIGDNDSGQILWFEENARNYRYLEDFVSCLEGHGVDLNQNGKLHWSLAIANKVNRPDALPVAEIERVAAVTVCRSGFLSGRINGSVCVMRVGEQGLMGRASHDHDDALSIWMSYNGEDFIIEEGCHSYTLDLDIREKYIGSLAHNLVQPLGQNRYKPIDGSIVKTPKGAETASAWTHTANDDGITLWAEMAVPLKKGQPFLECNRTVTLQGKDLDTELLIFDNWSWHEKRPAEVRWHLAPDLSIIINNETCEAEIFDNKNNLIAIFEFEGSCTTSIEIFDFGYAPVYGSFSPSRGIKVVLEKHQKASLKSHFKFPQQL